MHVAVLDGKLLCQSSLRLQLMASFLIRAGQDRAFRLFSVIQDQQSRELSQHHVSHRAKRARLDPSELKLAPLAALAACQV